MENTFDLKKFLIENKLTKNSKILKEVEQSVEIANNLKKIKVDAQAVISMAKNGIEDQEKYAGLNRDVNIDVQAVEQQIEVVEDALERIEDYAGDGWAVDIEDVAREKNIAELQNMLETLIEETDKLHSVYTGKPLQEGDLNEGWKQWALGAISTLSALGGGTAQAATNSTVDTDQPGIEMTATPRTKVDINKMSNKEVYDATIKAAKSMGVDRAIDFVETLPANTKEESTDKQMLLTFLQSIKNGSPIKETEYIGKRLKMAFRFTSELIYTAGNSMKFFDKGGNLR
jgi:hypothetical protein